jgi:hypothetical protein
MNTSCARPPSSSAESARTQDVSRRPDSGEDRRRGDDFERLLRCKAAAQDDDGEPESGTTLPDQDTRGLAGLMPLGGPPPLLLARATSTPALATTAAPESNLAAPHAALEAALNANPGPSALVPGAEAGGAWEVSLHESMGVAVEMRATRPASANAGGTPAAWTLTIGSSALDSAALARHAPRLNERLRARALTNTHVRIESSDKEAA